MLHLRLMTDRLHHCTFFQRLHTNQVLTFFSSSARWSGSDFMIWSNSANCGRRHGTIGAWRFQGFPALGATLTFPGRKNTLVNPNLKSLSFSPRALNRAYRGWSMSSVSESKKESLATSPRRHLAEESGVEARQLVRHVLFVHVVELVEGSSGGEAPLHQVQHRHHA